MIDFGKITDQQKAFWEQEKRRMEAMPPPLVKFALDCRKQSEKPQDSSQVVDAPESLTVELQKDDVIRMLKGSNAPFGMAWDERAMQEQPISELMEIYAQLNWSDKPIEESEAPRIVLASA